MKEKYQPSFSYTNAIVKKLTEAVSKEAHLKNRVLSADQKLDISYLANIDAVHFSTKLEGNALSLKQVTQALEGHRSYRGKREIKEVINYSKAKAFLQKRSLSRFGLDNKLVLDTHGILLNGIVTGKLWGHYRDSQNVIKDSKNGHIVYLPPEASDVKSLMAKLLMWGNQGLFEEISPYIVAAIFHYYFVTVHPFLDGNGRTARLLTTFILLSQNIVLSEYAALEKQHERNRSTYYLQLRQLQAPTFYDIPKDIDLTPWISYWMDCVLATYDEALARCAEPKVESQTLWLNDRLQKATSLFKRHQKLKASDYERLMGLGRTQAVHDLNRLIKNGVIERRAGGRSQIYVVKGF